MSFTIQSIIRSYESDNNTRLVGLRRHVNNQISNSDISGGLNVAFGDATISKFEGGGPGPTSLEQFGLKPVAADIIRKLKQYANLTGRIPHEIAEPTHIAFKLNQGYRDKRYIPFPDESVSDDDRATYNITKQYKDWKAVAVAVKAAQRSWTKKTDEDILNVIVFIEVEFNEIKQKYINETKDKLIKYGLNPAIADFVDKLDDHCLGSVYKNVMKIKIVAFVKDEELGFLQRDDPVETAGTPELIESNNTVDAVEPDDAVSGESIETDLRQFKGDFENFEDNDSDTEHTISSRESFEEGGPVGSYSDVGLVEL